MKKHFTKTAKVFALTFLSLALGITACKKDKYISKTDADNTYQPKGNYVTVGQNNNTVNMSSFSVSPGSWSTYNSYELYYNTSVSVPTTDVCMVYFSTDNSTFQPLPASSHFDSGDNLYFDYTTGYNIQLAYYDANGVSGNITQTLYFKVADIPPAQKLAHPNLNYKDYTAVKKAFNLK